MHLCAAVCPSAGNGVKRLCYRALVPVDSTHLDYDTTATAWLRARDVFAGEDAVKAAGVRYLPRLDSQTDDEYLAYKSRASFFNATARTADGFVGLIFRREPTVELPAGGSGVGRALGNFAEDADMLGTALSAYAKNVVCEVIGVGRAGTLVDWEGEVEQRAYAVLYTAEQIINWRVARVNGRNILSLVVLKECGTPGAGGGTCVSSQRSGESAEGDGFVTEMVEQIRVLKLEQVQSLESGVQSQESGDVRRSADRRYEYRVELWRRVRSDKRRGKPEWQLVETRIPLRLGKPLPQIPFVFHGPRHSLPDLDKLPLADIIAVNLDHYRLNADYHHGLHFTALPTAWVSGFDKSATLRIGSSTAWVSETAGATAGFLEFTGQGLTTFERAMDRDERLMAVLGTRMLEGQKRVGETADAIELRQSGENSVLNAVSLSVSDSLTHVLRWVYWWNSTEATPEAIGEDQVLVQLNTDFSAKGMASAELKAVVGAWQAGAFSRETMLELFRRGEVLPAGRSNEEEVRLTAEGQRAEGGGQTN